MSDGSQPASLPLGFRKTVFYRLSLFGTVGYEFLSKANPDPEDKILHYNTILSGEKKKGALILGAQPLESLLGDKLSQGTKIIKMCEKKRKPLGMVVSVLTPEEMEGTDSKNIIPVSAKFWQDQLPKVEHVLLPMNDLSGTIDLDTLKKAIDNVATLRKNNQSAYIHCKAGCGRSFTFVMCYLMLHSSMSLNHALEKIFHKRHQIYPSASQFKLIEACRQKYCNDPKQKNYKAPLDLRALQFNPLENNLSIVAKNPLLHTLLGTGVGFGLSQFILGVGLRIALAFAGVGGLVLGAFSWIAQNIRHRIRDNAYLKLPQVHNKDIKTPEVRKQLAEFAKTHDKADAKQLLTTKRHEKLREELSKLSLAELKAMQCGVESADSWFSYFSPQRMLSPNATWHYSKYLAGMRAKYEDDSIIRPDVLPEVIKQKSKPAA